MTSVSTDVFPEDAPTLTRLHDGRIVLRYGHRVTVHLKDAQVDDLFGAVADFMEKDRTRDIASRRAVLSHEMEGA